MMEGLTPELKAEIDGLSIEELRERCRNDPVGHPMWSLEAGRYALAKIDAAIGSESTYLDCEPAARRAFQALGFQ